MRQPVVLSGTDISALALALSSIGSPTTQCPAKADRTSTHRGHKPDGTELQGTRSSPLQIHLKKRADLCPVIVGHDRNARAVRLPPGPPATGRHPFAAEFGLRASEDAGDVASGPREAGDQASYATGSLEGVDRNDDRNGLAVASLRRRNGRRRIEARNDIDLEPRTNSSAAISEGTSGLSFRADRASNWRCCAPPTNPRFAHCPLRTRRRPLVLSGPPVLDVDQDTRSRGSSLAALAPQAAGPLPRPRQAP